PGQLDTLSKVGIRAYRGLDPNWYCGLRGGLSRVGHLLDCLLTLAPPVSNVLQSRGGLLDVTGSYLLWGSGGFRRWIPQSCRARQIDKGISRCIHECALFHLWMHPIDIAYKTRSVLDTLRRSLERVARHREAGELSVMTMAEVARQYLSGRE
ncbi:MAG: hypothetical protein ACP5KN_16345, partial [Armatimonadota bacterium]